MPGDLLARYLSDRKLKLTPQRKIILNAFLDHGGHVSSEELYDIVKEQNPGIGQATVYRAMKLLAEAGIASEVRFGDGISRYELKDEQEHHDHIICEKCFRQVEFSDPTIEDLQMRQAEKHGFVLVSHRMILYGICSKCRS